MTRVVDARTGSTTRPPVWTCPRCGARLVSRNLWHSCGRFTLKDLFSDARPGVLDLARKYVAMLEYGPRWRGHFVDVRSDDDLDEQLRGWLQESHDTVGVQDDPV